jgi:hypothetical protein
MMRSRKDKYLSVLFRIGNDLRRIYKFGGICMLAIVTERAGRTWNCPLWRRDAIDAR